MQGMTFLERLGIELPIIQAPMAGVSTPSMAAAVSNGGGLGSIAVGAGDASAARAMIQDVKARTSRAFNVNLFVHAPPRIAPDVDRAWLEAMSPLFARLPGGLLHTNIAVCTLFGAVSGGIYLFVFWLLGIISFNKPPRRK